MDPTVKAKADVLLKEYEIAANRYENIYKAIWQNFNYLAVLSAGFAAFGERLVPDRYWQVFFALLPLTFWYLAIYVPMDSYARGARKRAGEIEGLITQLVADNSVRLAHFTEFGGAHPELHWRGKGRMPWLHVSDIVNASFLLVSVITLVAMFAGICSDSISAERPKASIVVLVDSLSGDARQRTVAMEEILTSLNRRVFADSVTTVELIRGLSGIRGNLAGINRRLSSLDSVIRNR